MIRLKKKKKEKQKSVRLKKYINMIRKKCIGKTSKLNKIRVTLLNVLTLFYDINSLN